MSQERNLEAEKQRAWKAKELLENELFNEAFDLIQDGILKQWEAAPARDLEGKEHLWQLYKVSVKYKSIINGYIQAGEFAEAQLRQKQSVVDKMLKVVGK